MKDEKLESMSTGDVALGYATITQDIFEEILLKLVDKGIFDSAEVKEIINSCLIKQDERIKAIEVDESLDSDQKQRVISMYELAKEKWNFSAE